MRRDRKATTHCTFAPTLGRYNIGALVSVESLKNIFYMDGGTSSQTSKGMPTKSPQPP